MLTKTPMKLDHITVVARTLEEGSAYIKNVLGINMPEGGAHPRMGTHNRLLSLGGAVFLELIAIDPEATSPGRPRWFDLDRFDDTPRLGTWVLRTDNIATALSKAHPDSGCKIEITRGNLKWLISIPDDGTMPLEGAFPTLIEWPDGPHPASEMTDLGCRLVALSIEHPKAGDIAHLLEGRIDHGLIKFTQSPAMRITATIRTPTGIKKLT